MISLTHFPSPTSPKPAFRPMNRRLLFRKTLLLAPLLAAGAITSAQAQIEPAARVLAESVSSKLGSARTIRLTAKHQLDPALGVGSKLESGPLQITVRRPNRFYVIQQAGDETRELAYDGRAFSLIQPVLKQHALEPLQAASIDQLADTVDARFGFRPPVAELLSADVGGQLFRGVTSARVTGTARLGWTRCQVLKFEQPGMTGEVWISAKDHLPLRYVMTFTGTKGSPKWDIRLSRWELNVPVDETLFSKRAPAGSARLRMLKSR